MKRYLNGGRKKITDRNNSKPTEGHIMRTITSKNYNRGKNGREKEKKTKNDVTGLDAERGLQQIEGESWRS